ncbi:YciI family protein [Halocola ammonii]
MKELLFFALLLTSGFASAQEEKSNPREFEMTEGDTTYVMKQYFMLIYLTGDNQEEVSREKSTELQEGHLGHINKMADEGVVKMAGPFGDQTEKRGILIFDLDTKEEVVEWVSQDPLVKAGRLKYEIHPWWTAKGSCLD